MIRILIIRILNVNPQKRITIEDIERHCFLNAGKNMIDSLKLYDKISEPSKMEKMLNYSSEKSLKKDKKNTYSLKKKIMYNVNVYNDNGINNECIIE